MKLLGIQRFGHAGISPQKSKANYCISHLPYEEKNATLDYVFGVLTPLTTVLKDPNTLAMDVSLISLLKEATIHPDCNDTSSGCELACPACRASGSTLCDGALFCRSNLHAGKSI